MHKLSVDTGEKCQLGLVNYFLDPDPHLASLFHFRRDVRDVCVWEHVCVCKCAQIWSRHQSWEI